MQKLFKNCYEMDRKSYEKFHLTEDILMEHAASSMQKFIQKKFPKKSKVLIVSGVGNNGADGIALARLLHKEYKVKLFIPFGLKSQMATLQLKRAKAVGVKVVKKIKKADIIVDALFGAGLKRELNEQTIEIIKKLNRMDGYKIACDIPTGINEQGALSPIAFRADTTITMGALKEALYSDEAKDYVGKIEVANLGVARELYEDESSSFVLQKEDFNPPIRRKKSSHKGDYGHVGVFVGQKSGAAIISATAAARFGAGLVTLIYHEKITHPPFLMSSSTMPSKINSIAIGMGLGEYFEKEFLQKYVIDSLVAVVLDADSFYKKELLEIVYQKDRKVVLTPHPKEFSSLFEILENRKISVEEIQKDRFQIAREFGSKYPNVVLVLKGANPIIVKGERVFVNPLGKEVLAKGGSGDILSGLIAALLAQGRDELDSAINGSLALALASRRYKGANYSALPNDIINIIPKLRRKK